MAQVDSVNDLFASPGLLESQILGAISKGLESIEDFATRLSSLQRSLTTESLHDEHRSSNIHTISSNITKIASAFLEIEQETQNLTTKLDTSLEEIFQSISLEDKVPQEEWLLHHLHNPYPSKQEKRELAKLSGGNERSIEMWFTNVRSRIGWTGIVRRYFKGSKHVAIDHASCILTSLENQTNLKVSIASCFSEDITRAFMDMRSKAYRLFSSKIKRDEESNVLKFIEHLDEPSSNIGETNGDSRGHSNRDPQIPIKGPKRHRANSTSSILSSNSYSSSSTYVEDLRPSNNKNQPHPLASHAQSQKLDQKYEIADNTPVSKLKRSRSSAEERTTKRRKKDEIDNVNINHPSSVKSEKPSLRNRHRHKHISHLPRGSNSSSGPPLSSKESELQNAVSEEGKFEEYTRTVSPYSRKRSRSPSPEELLSRNSDKYTSSTIPARKRRRRDINCVAYSDDDLLSIPSRLSIPSPAPLLSLPSPSTSSFSLYPSSNCPVDKTSISSVDEAAASMGSTMKNILPLFHSSSSGSELTYMDAFDFQIPQEPTLDGLNWVADDNSGAPASNAIETEIFDASVFNFASCYLPSDIGVSLDLDHCADGGVFTNNDVSATTDSGANTVPELNTDLAQSSFLSLLSDIPPLMGSLIPEYELPSMPLTLEALAELDGDNTSLSTHDNLDFGNHSYGNNNETTINNGDSADSPALSPDSDNTCVGSDYESALAEDTHVPKGWDSVWKEKPSKIMCADAISETLKPLSVF